MPKPSKTPLHLPPLTDEEDRAITAAALADPDAQPATDEEMDRMVPFHVMFGRPPLANPKRLVSIRYNPEVLEFFRAGGPGWQTRMNEVLEKHVARARKRTGAKRGKS